MKLNLYSLIATAFAGAMLIAGNASAHPSPNILQAGGAKGDRVSYTGITYKRENNVGVYRGRAALLGDSRTQSIAPPKRSTPPARVITNFVFYDPPARLRTHRVFSTSSRRPFTQGFYSGYPSTPY